MSTIVPPLGRFVERIVVTFPLVLDQMFQTDVTANFKTGLIEEKQSQQPRHPPVTIGEWMDAEEIEHVGRNQQQWIDFFPVPLFLKKGMEPIHGLGRLMGGNRSESGNLCAVGPGLGNLIVRHFPASALLGHELIKIAVELKDKAGVNGILG